MSWVSLVDAAQVPTNFVLPTEFFDFNSVKTHARAHEDTLTHTLTHSHTHTLTLTQGLTTAELEFPAYFNYFVLKKRVTIITTQEGLKYLEVRAVASGPCMPSHTSTRVRV